VPTCLQFPEKKMAALSCAVMLQKGQFTTDQKLRRLHVFNHLQRFLIAEPCIRNIDLDPLGMSKRALPVPVRKGLESTTLATYELHCIAKKGAAAYRSCNFVWRWHRCYASADDSYRWWFCSLVFRAVPSRNVHNHSHPPSRAAPHPTLCPQSLQHRVRQAPLSRLHSLRYRYFLIDRQQMPKGRTRMDTVSRIVRTKSSMSSSPFK